jgi:hypothetical protein
MMQADLLSHIVCFSDKDTRKNLRLLSKELRIIVDTRAPRFFSVGARLARDNYDHSEACRRWHFLSHGPLPATLQYLYYQGFQLFSAEQSIPACLRYLYIDTQNAAPATLTDTFISSLPRTLVGLLVRYVSVADGAARFLPSTLETFVIGSMSLTDWNLLPKKLQKFETEINEEHAQCTPTPLPSTVKHLALKIPTNFQFTDTLVACIPPLQELHIKLTGFISLHPLPQHIKLHVEFDHLCRFLTTENMMSLPKVHVMTNGINSPPKCMPQLDVNELRITHWSESGGNGWLSALTSSPSTLKLWKSIDAGALRQGLKTKNVIEMHLKHSISASSVTKHLDAVPDTVKILYVNEGFQKANPEDFMKWCKGHPSISVRLIPSTSIDHLFWQ